MSLTLIGKKRGMTRIFDKKSGKVLPCTVIELRPNVVSQIKTVENDGYTAVQMAALEVPESKKRNVSKPLLGHFSKKKIEPHLKLLETRLKATDGLEVGKEFSADYFAEGSLVDVTGISKGKGYQGVIKRHGKSRIVKSHGAGPVVRHIGSSGSLTAHGRVHKGKKMAGQMGNTRKTVERLEVLKVDTVLNAVIVKGSIPGANGSVVSLRKTLKEKV